MAIDFSIAVFRSGKSRRVFITFTSVWKTEEMNVIVNEMSEDVFATCPPALPLHMEIGQ